MAFLDALIGDPRFRSTLRDRAGGQDTLASQVYGQARAANAGAAQGTAARAMDQGVNPALANRLAARQEGAANAAAGQTFAQQQTAERAQAEQQLAAMRQQRQAFLRNLLGSAVQTGSAMSTLYMKRPGGLLNPTGDGPQGLPASGVVMGADGPVTGQPTGQGPNAGNFGNAPGGMGDGLLLRQVAPVAGMAAGGPLGAAMGQALGNGLASAVSGEPQQQSTMGLVDQALATPVPGGGASVAAPASIPGGDAPQAGTNDEFLTWLLQNRGMR